MGLGIPAGPIDVSYCGGIYPSNGAGTTPQWAATSGDFYDYRSCVQWYHEAAAQAR